MSKSESQKVRAKLYRNRSFRRELADGLGLGGMRQQIASCLDALLETRRLPSRGDTNAGAAASDAALILIAAGTMQTNKEALLSLTERLSAMNLSKVVDISSPAKRDIPLPKASDLVADLAKAFKAHWEAPDGAFLEGRNHVAFITKIGDAPAGDAAVLVRISDNRQNSYSASASPTAEDERVRRTTRGGMSFMPSAFANFANQLRDDLDGTVAAVRGPHPSVWTNRTSARSGGGEERVAVADTQSGTTIAAPDFVQILLEHVGGDMKAGETSLLRFELLGHAIVDGVDYRREGGPNDHRKSLASQILEIGDMAMETASRHPDGWVVVDAYGRPTCRLGEGECDFHRGAEIVVFGSEYESVQFANRVNAQSGDDPALPALSLSARRFAKEASTHADAYRRIIKAEGLDIHATGDAG